MTPVGLRAVTSVSCVRAVGCLHNSVSYMDESVWVRWLAE